MTETWDAVVIGGGAAGFFGAIICAQKTVAPARVLIVEKSRRVLNKVKISGGGRCNVTHHCFEPKAMATRHYPRGNKALIGPMYRFGVTETVQWFAERQMELKTEADGRMFPTTDDSQTVINCLRKAADEAGIEVRTATGVRRIQRADQNAGSGFVLTLSETRQITTDQVLIATGGTRLKSSASLPEELGHDLVPAVPSLFTFDVDDPRIEGLPGLSVDPVEVQIDGEDLDNDGPLLITHQGFSGPAILKVSAWGARILHGLGYRFTLIVNWLPGEDVPARLRSMRHEAGKRQVATRSPFEKIPNRLWRRLVEAAKVPDGCRWSSLPRQARIGLVEQLTQARFEVHAKSTFKEEFVTCGGVSTDDVDMRTMESRLHDGIFYAGEVLDIDGITGGFNFQNAWTTGYLAGQAIASNINGQSNDG